MIHRLCFSLSSSIFSFLFFTHLFLFLLWVFILFFCCLICPDSWFLPHYAAERGPSFKARWEDATRPLSQGWYEHIENTVKCTLTFHMLFTYGCPMQLNLLVWQIFSPPPSLHSWEFMSKSSVFWLVSVVE
jgi:hypothetical protein